MIISLQDSLNLLNIIISPFHRELATHLQRTAYISLCLASELQLSEDQTKRIYLAANLHDAGILNAKMQRNLTLPEFGDEMGSHEKSGVALFREVRFLEPLLPVIAHHHIYRDEIGWQTSISIDNQIINMADEFERFLRGYGEHLIVNAPTIMSTFFRTRHDFSPDLTQALTDLASHDVFWFRLESQRLHSVLKQISPLNLTLLRNDEFLEICVLISRIVDNYSSHTGTHSASVAAVAGYLSACLGFSGNDQQEISIAGYLHDIGKVHIPVDILDKQGHLTSEEYALMREHSYKTLEMLMPIKPLGRITNWAANHHERLDGSGYPFGLKAGALDMPSRILAVADVFTALTENRPYRRGLTPRDALEIIRKESDESRLDWNVVNMLEMNLQEAYQQVIMI